MRSDSENRPSFLLGEYLEGRSAKEDLPAPILSWLRFAIYRKAVEVLSFRKIEDRRACLAGMPAHLLADIKVEVTRIWKYRQPKETF